MRTLPVIALLAFSGVAAAVSSSGSTLVSAIRSSDYASVRALLAARDADPDQLLPDGSTPLSWAAESQDPAMVRLLLEARARPNAARNAGAAPLMLACEHGNAEVIELLLKAGADVARARSDGATPLSLCAGSAPAATLERLIAAGAAVDVADQRGQTPLMWAAANGRLDNLRLLLARGANVNRATSKGFTPLFFALKSGQPEVAAAVLDAGGDAGHVGPEATTAVQLAMYQKQYEMAARLIAGHTDLTAFDRNGNTLLHAAVLGDQPALVKQLLEKGADPNKLSGTPRVEWRFEANFKSDKYQVSYKPPLLLAAEAGSPEIMQALIGAGADPKFRMPDGSTLLHAVITTDRAAAVDVALRAWPDPNVADAEGRTPLQLLLRDRDNRGAESVAIMRLLAAAGASTGKPGQARGDQLARAAESVRAAYLAAFGTEAGQP